MSTQMVPNIKSVDQIRQELDSVSPLALSKYLMEYEIADMQSSLVVLEDIHKEFDDGSGAKIALLEALGLGLADGIIRSWSAARKIGLTASKLYHDINSFTYGDSINPSEIDNCFDEHDQIIEDKVPYDRKNVEDKRALEEYRDSELKEDGPVPDGYDLETKISDKNPRKWSTRHRMDVDHVVSAKNIHKQMSLFNYAPVDAKEREKMVKDVANTEANLLIVNRSINRSKRDAHNVSYVINNWDKLKPSQRSAMLKAGARSQTEVAAKMAVGLTSKELKKAKNIEDLTHKMNNSGTRLVLSKQLGSIISVTISPFWYEIKDISMNGVCHNLDTEDCFLAIGRRLINQSIII